MFRLWILYLCSPILRSLLLAGFAGVLTVVVRQEEAIASGVRWRCRAAHRGFLESAGDSAHGKASLGRLEVADGVAHELTHIRRFDWAIGFVAALARCVFWFNPPVWWIERRLSALAEQASDDAGISFTGDAARYAETLLDFAAAAKSGCPANCARASPRAVTPGG